MKKQIALYFLILMASLVSFGCDNSTEPEPPATGQTITSDFDVMVEGKTVNGCGLGIDDAAESRDWMQNDADSMSLEYPGVLAWASVFITVGDPKPENRPWFDISACTNLAIEMKGEVGGEKVLIGIKDKVDPDNGLETKKSATLTKDWNVYEFKLSDFFTCDLKNVYVIAEFVFPAGSKKEATTVHIKNIRILK
jgi:hypothetical protein